MLAAHPGKYRTVKRITAIKPEMFSPITGPVPAKPATHHSSMKNIDKPGPQRP